MGVNQIYVKPPSDLQDSMLKTVFLHEYNTSIFKAKVNIFLVGKRDDVTEAWSAYIRGVNSECIDTYAIKASSMDVIS